MRLACLLLLFGCKDLPEVTPDTCGNAVVELGEDCDLFSDPALGQGTSCGAAGTTQACRYLCDVDGDPPCPTNWGCGQDGVCRYPSGDYRETAAFDFPAQRLALADVDGDGEDDLVGGHGAPDPVNNDADLIAVRFGAAGDLVEGTLFPAAGSTLAVADVDQDGRADVVTPVGGGLLVLTGQAERMLAPLAFSSFTLADLDLGEAVVMQGGLRLRPVHVDPRIESDAILAFISADVGGNPFAGAFFFADADGSGGALPEASGRSFNDLAGPIEAGDVDGDGSDEIAFAFRGDTSVYVYTLVTTGGCVPVDRMVSEAPCLWCDTVGDCYQEVLTRIAQLTVPVPVHRGVKLADGDGDGDLDLFVSVDADPGAAVVEGIMRSTFGILFGPLAFDARLSPGAAPYAAECGDTTPENRSTIFGPLAYGTLDADADADFVTPIGIYRNDGATVCQLAWNPSANFEGDFGNYREAQLGDFNHDGQRDVVAARGELSGLDVHLGDGMGRFVLHFIETEFPPKALRVADYDGDLIDDVAFAEERWRDGESEGESLAIIYGNVEGPPSPPVTMGRLQYVTALETAQFRTAFTLDGFADLIAQTSASMGGQGTESVGLMFGSADGRLLSVFGLGLLGASRGQPQVALIGSFNPGDTIPDLAAAADTSLWRATGSGMGQFNLDDLDTTAPAAYASVAPTRFLAVDLDADGRDELLGISDDAEVLVATADADGFTARSIGQAAGLTEPTSAEVLDLDGDGALDLVVSFASGGVVVFPTIDGETLPAAVTVSTERAQAVRAVNTDRDGALELVIVGDDAVSIAQPDGSGGWLPLEQVARRGGTCLVTGDLDGDGLHELIVGDHTGVHVLSALPAEVRP